MKRFFFHADNGRRFQDDEGTLLPDLAAAKVEAARVLGQLLCEDPASVWTHRRLSLRVEDEGGDPLLALELTARSPGDTSARDPDAPRVAGR